MKKTHKLSNSEVVAELKEVLAAMEVKEASYFRIRAYQNVMSVIEGLTMGVYNMWENKKLDDIPGMGVALKNHLDELFTTGEVKEFNRFKEDLPQGMFSLIGLRGIGAKKAYKLAVAFELDTRKDTLEKVKKAALAGQIRNLEGFGEKSEKSILESISELKKTKNEKQRVLLFKAEQIEQRVISYLKGHPEIDDAIALGSFRRRKSTVGDLDIAIKTDKPETAINYFLRFSEIEEVLVSGDKRVSVVIGDDLQVDIRVCDPRSFGSMIQYFTGSKAHNIVLRTHALRHGASLSEYGIKKNDELNEFEHEEDFYKFLELQYIGK